MPKLWSTYDWRLIYKTSYEEITAFLSLVWVEFNAPPDTLEVISEAVWSRHDSLAKHKIALDSVRKLAYDILSRNVIAL